METVTVSRPSRSKVKPEVKIEIHKKETVDNILSLVFKIKKLPQEDISKLLKLKTKKSRAVLDIDNRDFLYEFIHIYETIGLAATLKFFEGADMTKDLLWTSSVFEPERKKEVIDADILLNRQKVKGGKCKRCGSENVVVFSLQIRSADEPMTVITRCFSCGFVHKE